MSTRLVPEFFSCIKDGCDRKNLGREVMAGVLVGIVALPLAIAFAIASGVKPEQGIFTAIIAGFLISFLSGSRVQIGGPTGAFIVVVFGIVAKFGYDGLAMATLMAGVFLVGMGLARMGAVIKFIPYPMTVGFTSGIALIIATTQIKDFFGLTIPAISGEFIHRVMDYGHYADTLNPSALLIGAISLLIIVFWGKVTRKIPGSIIAILVGTGLVYFLGLPVETIGSQFGSVPSMLPMPRLPHLDWGMLPQLIPAALTIALLGAIESLLSAVVADGMTGMRHRSNMELVAQGVANIAVPFFGGIPATGAIARTATNIKNGGRTPVAGMVHAVTLLLILLLFGRWAVLIPMPTLAAVLLVVAFHMSEWQHFVKLFRASKSDILVMLSTFFLTVFVDLTVAIQTGVVLSALLFMNRMAQVTEVRNITAELNEEYGKEDALAIATREVPKGVEVFEIYGPFFFGAVTQFKDTLNILKNPAKVLVLRMRHILTIDATALHALEDLLSKTRKDGTALILSGVRPQLRVSLDRNRFSGKIGPENIYGHIDDALAGARRYLGESAQEGMGE
ncbi:SulP family inorganic anion transporter [Thiovibrio frasassiensis]|uniref:SulP family inorganic anion transporter n=1 Tax=Thiovibrio frasassiensis TaxID=2984131 RepID=A0A9X4MLM0_9BACT|nr:SulP family inorganic anion transporter [Thiovibrio frasassiensis]MDG4475052.1 SulP family inorganic anion transporter [Thiovibrio frasassiensis]